MRPATVSNWRRRDRARPMAAIAVAAVGVAGIVTETPLIGRFLGGAQ